MSREKRNAFKISIKSDAWRNVGEHTERNDLRYCCAVLRVDSMGKQKYVDSLGVGALNDAPDYGDAKSLRLGLRLQTTSV